MAHPNTQQHMTNLWYGDEMQFLLACPVWKKLIALALAPVVIPVFCVLYIIFPNSWVSATLLLCFLVVVTSPSLLRIK